MTRYDITPLQGIGPIHLGMTRSQVRAVMPGDPKTFRKGATTEVDAWHTNSFQVFYDDQRRAEFIELSRTDAFQAVLHGVDVFRSKAEALVRHLDARHPYDRDDTEDGHSFTFLDVELALWREHVPEPGEADAGDNGVRFDTVGIGRRGYFGDAE